MQYGHEELLKLTSLEIKTEFEWERGMGYHDMIKTFLLPQLYA